MRAHLVPQFTLAVRREPLTRIRKHVGINSEAELARLMGFDKGTLSRALLGKSDPGPRFIAQLLHVLGMHYFTELFAIVPAENTDNGHAA